MWAANVKSLHLNHWCVSISANCASTLRWLMNVHCMITTLLGHVLKADPWEMYMDVSSLKSVWSAWALSVENT